ncbi:MAG: hypothetical protein JO011_00365 [Ktedonobacteraceae bacterium]|nr:hypothetical protein [Ktedonobacteraceae bacterium]
MSRLKKIFFQAALVFVALLALTIGGISLRAVHASNAASVSQAAASKTLNAYVTSYGFNDNSPPSADIAYPVIHQKATEGKGTYSDPITFATDKSEIGVGTRVYVPFLQKYFIMEDDCAECDSDWSGSHKYHIDLWMGPQHSSNATSLYNCEDSITRDSTQIIVKPARNLTVDTTPLFKNNKCTAVIH